MINVVGDGTFTSSIDVPEGTDPVAIAAVSTALTKLQNSNRFHGNSGDQIKDNLRAHSAGVGAGGIGVFASMASALTNVSGMTTTITPIGIGDVIEVELVCNVLATASGTQAQMQLRYQSATMAPSATIIPGACNSLFDITADGTQVVLKGRITVTTVELVTITVRAGYGAVAGADITDSWYLTAKALRGGSY